VSTLVVDVLLTLFSLGLILLAAELFTNAVEWLGYKLKLAEGAVGSVLAAVGTALPETIIPVVAIIKDARAHTLFTPQSEAQAVGLGAIIGAPFMLGTLAFALVGGTYLLCKRGSRKHDEFNVATEIFKSDAEFFMIAFSMAAAFGVLRYYWPAMPRSMDWALGVTMIVLYFLYLGKIMKQGEVSHGKAELHPLYVVRAFWGPHREPGKRWIILQLFFSLCIMFAGAHMFVEHLQPLALAMGVPALILALLIVPVATELPEKFNSVLWVRRGKDTLALGNISGALVFQSTFPVTLGLFFLDWSFSPTHPALISAIFGLIGALIVYIGLKRTGKVQPKLLVAAGGLYIVYLLLITAHMTGLIQLDVPEAIGVHHHASAAP
jgi:cation:H+ antiporter